MSIFNVTMIGDTQLIGKLEGMPNKVRQALERKVTALGYRLLALVKGKLSGEVLHVRSGLLRDSAVFPPPTVTATSVKGRVAEPGSVPYAAIHEFGGTINHPGGTPYIVVTGEGAVFISKAKAEAMGNKVQFTRPHAINIPERSYLRSSLGDMETEIREGLAEAVREGVQLR